LEGLNLRLTPELREAIMTIKAKALQSSQYYRSRYRLEGTSGKFWSYHIYEAVMVHGVRRYDEFQKHLLETKGIRA
jgi:hypothetical protein